MCIGTHWHHAVASLRCKAVDHVCNPKGPGIWTSQHSSSTYTTARSTLTTFMTFSYSMAMDFDTVSLVDTIDA